LALRTSIVVCYGQRYRPPRLASIAQRRGVTRDMPVAIGATKSHSQFAQTMALPAATALTLWFLFRVDGIHTIARAFHRRL